MVEVRNVNVRGLDGTTTTVQHSTTFGFEGRGKQTKSVEIYRLTSPAGKTVRLIRNGLYEIDGKMFREVK